MCVMKRCAEIAQMYEVDIETMQKIGIAHDIAKEISFQEGRIRPRQRRSDGRRFAQRRAGGKLGRINVGGKR